MFEDEKKQKGPADPKEEASGELADQSTEETAEQTTDQTTKEPTLKEVPKVSAEEDFEKKYLYLYAEFENFKKQVFKERSHQRKYGHQKLAEKMLEVIDNLERSRRAFEDKAFQEGMDLILKQFYNSLEQFGVVKIKTTSEIFNPHWHESLSVVPSDTPDVILEEVRSGYKIHDYVLRPAQVVVGGEKD